MGAVIQWVWSRRAADGGVEKNHERRDSGLLGDA
jgi:hypothetical protein